MLLKLNIYFLKISNLHFVIIPGAHKQSKTPLCYEDAAGTSVSCLL